MLKYFELEEKMQTVSAQLSWSHYCELLFIEDINEIKYYINISVILNLSVRKLRDKIKTKEYERLNEETKLKLINKEDNNVADFVKNPILIKNSYNYENTRKE